jgi:hypothetical protein
MSADAPSSVSLSAGADRVGTPPRTLATLCAHELTHIIVWEHIGLARFHVPKWIWEGFPDYVAIKSREFEQLRDALGDRPVGVPMMMKYGFYPRCRLLVTFTSRIRDGPSRRTTAQERPRPR